MRIRLELSSEREYIKLPIGYNELIQAMLYKSLSRLLAKFLHDIGFFYNKRPFKLYTFSRIISSYVKIFKDSNTINFKSPIVVYISSSVSEITETLGENMLQKDYIRLGQNRLNIERIDILKPPILYENKIKVRTLSPITVYKTFLKEDGKKFYRFYNPQEDEFKDLIKQNIKKKFEIIKAQNIEDFDFDIKPLKESKKTISRYKDFFIEAYEGEFLLDIDPYIFSTIYDSGLGAKNSQGFGMIEVMDYEE